MFCDFYIHLQIGFKFRMNECFIYITDNFVSHCKYLSFNICNFLVHNSEQFNAFQDDDIHCLQVVYNA